MKYPILLVHGMGFRDDRKISYWGRINKSLASRGYKIILSGQDSNGSVESNAKQIAQCLDKYFSTHKDEKVNIIAHSKGGLEARFLISSMGYSDRIASVTTLSTPHNGSHTVDFFLKIPEFLIKVGCKVADLWFRILGDKKPDTYSAICSFRTDDAEKFNAENTDHDNILYQSFGFVMKNSFSDFSMWFPYLVVKAFDGENDGLLSPASVKWTNFRGICTGSGISGISHCDEVDMWRRNMKINTPYGEKSIVELYLAIADELEKNGY